jgi:hypothetical protein
MRIYIFIFFKVEYSWIIFKILQISSFLCFFLFMNRMDHPSGIRMNDYDSFAFLAAAVALEAPFFCSM